MRVRISTKKAAWRTLALWWFINIASCSMVIENQPYGGDVYKYNHNPDGSWVSTQEACRRHDVDAEFSFKYGVMGCAASFAAGVVIFLLMKQMTEEI